MLFRSVWETAGPAWETAGPAWKTIGPAWETIGPAWETVGPVWETAGPVWETAGPAWETVAACAANLADSASAGAGIDDAVNGMVPRGSAADVEPMRSTNLARAHRALCADADVSYLVCLSGSHPRFTGL